MNLPRSKLKNAFYILIALALVYVFLINASLNNTSKEALTPDFEKIVFDNVPDVTDNSQTIEDNSESGSDVTEKLRLYQVEMTNYRSDLDDRLKDLKTNPPSKDIGYTTESYTTIVWATLGTVLLFLIFTELE
jgi:hypothetical protein